jgi:hypothetical protein
VAPGPSRPLAGGYSGGAGEGDGHSIVGGTRLDDGDRPAEPGVEARRKRFQFF